MTDPQHPAGHRYDRLGIGYSLRRRADPRIAAQILEALADASTVVNIGAGSGSYEPQDRSVMAVEPSMVMIDQRPGGAAPVVRARAEALPFADDSFDCALAVLTIHHWSDLALGLSELRRVSRRRVVVLTVDPSVRRFWLLDYFPELADVDQRVLPPLSVVHQHLGRCTVIDVPIPHDCADGFLGAHWRRPDAYLNAEVRSSISGFSRISGVEAGVAALERDLESGEWDRRYGQLRGEPTIDLGYRIVVAT